MRSVRACGVRVGACACMRTYAACVGVSALAAWACCGHCLCVCVAVCMGLWDSPPLCVGPDMYVPMLPLHATGIQEAVFWGGRHEATLRGRFGGAHLGSEGFVVAGSDDGRFLVWDVRVDAGPPSVAAEFLSIFKRLQQARFGLGNRAGAGEYGWLWSWLLCFVHRIIPCMPWRTLLQVRSEALVASGVADDDIVNCVQVCVALCGYGCVWLCSCVRGCV